MYAVVRAGGKQYRVEEGATIEVDRLPGEPGTTLTLGEVLMVGDHEAVRAGTPFLKGATVTAEIVGHGKGEKITIFRYKNKTRSGRKTGHRAKRTTIRIGAIRP
ncbi:MAG: 50S ribosomal protein L21 [Candidatus Limnocylindria bacterium]